VLVAAAFCPCPPLIHPEVASGAAPELDDLRTACLDAVRAVAVEQNPDLVVVVGPDDRTGPYPRGSRGSLRPFGVDVVLGRGDGDAVLPPALSLGAWLCDEAGVTADVHAFGVAHDDEAARGASVGAGLADRAPRVALVVMGDGSARRDLKAPGGLDDRAEAFDRDVVQALASVDVDALAAMEPTTALALMSTGRAAWQAAAAAAASSNIAWSGTVLHESTPYGVGYLVATWLPE